MILLSACEQINNKFGSRPEDALIPKDVIESQIVNYDWEHTDLDRDMILNTMQGSARQALS